MQRGGSIAKAIFGATDARVDTIGTLPDIVTTKKNGTSEFDIDIDTEKMCVNLSSAISFVADQSKYVSFHRVLCNVPAGECPAVQCQHSLHLHNIMHTLVSTFLGSGGRSQAMGVFGECSATICS